MTQVKFHRPSGSRGNSSVRFVTDPEQSKPGKVKNYQATPEMLERIEKLGQQKYWEEYHNPKKRKNPFHLMPPKTKKKGG